MIIRFELENVSSTAAKAVIRKKDTVFDVVTLVMALNNTLTYEESQRTGTGCVQVSEHTNNRNSIEN